MTDSESDFSAASREYRRQIMKLLYAAADTPNETFSIREIAAALGVDARAVIREIENIPELIFNREHNTVRMRHMDFGTVGGMLAGNIGPAGVASSSALAAMGSSVGAVDRVGATGGGAGAHADRLGLGAGGALRMLPWEQIEAVGAVKKVKHRRPLGKSTDIRAVVPDGTKGRVGYVCVADEFILEELEKYYADQGYYTKCDYDVLHIRFSDKELQKQIQTTTTTTSNTTASGAGSGGAAANRALKANSFADPAAGSFASQPSSTGVSRAAGGTVGGQQRKSGRADSPVSTSATNTPSLVAPSTGFSPASYGSPMSVSATPAATRNQPGSASATASGAAAATAAAAAAAASNTTAKKHGFDLFVFQYGAIVWWGFDQKYFKIVEQDFMFPSSRIQKYLVNRYRTQTINEIYPVWCTYSLERKDTLEPDDDFKDRLLFDHFLIPYSAADLDSACISMLCASHALAQSAKIDYLEIKIQDLTQSCKPLPRELKEYGRVTITERRLLQLRGEVLSYRLMLKSGSDLLDEPELFWQNAYLKPIFQATKECFEIAERVRALDTKLDAGNEILSMIADQFTERHGARLEWIVIWLVLVEVIIGVLELLLDIKPWLT